MCNLALLLQAQNVFAIRLKRFLNVRYRSFYSSLAWLHLSLDEDRTDPALNEFSVDVLSSGFIKLW